MDNSKYWIMDGRAVFDIDSAMVLETCNTLSEAINSLELYADDSVVVEVETMRVLGPDELI